IKYRWEAIDAENLLIAEAKKSKLPYEPELLSNGDTEKQLLIRSRFLLFKQENKWSDSQKERAQLLFERYPLLKKAYDLAIILGAFTAATPKSRLLNTWQSGITMWKRQA
ncbi:MAG: transposase, partial [Bacteroidota bacterium]